MTRLEQLRLDASMTPEQLAAETGVSSRTIRRLESGQPHPQPATLAKLARYFNVPASDLPREALPVGTRHHRDAA